MGWSFTVADESRIVELGFPLSGAMPRVSQVPPFAVAAGTRHDDWRLADDSSGCNETLLLGSHAGSHLDGLAHVSSGGLLYGGRTALDEQTRWGVPYLDMTTVAPLVGPGFLVDLPRRLGVEVVDQAIDVGPDLLADALGQVPDGGLSGATLLLRTGWGRFWTADPPRFASLEEHRPGLSRDGAAWLADRGVRAVGTDSFTIESFAPAAERPVGMAAHVELLVRRGVHVFEALDLDALAAAGPGPFLFVALPLRMEGATGSPVRPIAIL